MTVSKESDKSDRESVITLDSWSERHPVSSDGAAWTEQEFFDFMNSQVFPNFLRGDSIKSMLNARLLKTAYGETGLAFFDSWRHHHLAGRLFEDEDRYELQASIMHLAYSWMSSLSKLNMNGSGIACRNGVESIIELAFQIRLGANQVWRRDSELVLPDEPDAVVAESIAVMPLSRFWQGEMALFPSLSWSYSNKAESIISFVFVASKDQSDKASTYRRLQMCFYSAQKHRRAVLCEDAPVFGVTLHDGALDFFVSTWVNDQLVVRPIFRRYTLRFFSDFVECYFLLCRIAEYTQKSLAWQFEQWQSNPWNTRIRIRESCNQPSWRGETRGDVAIEACDDSWIDVSKLKDVRERHSRIILASVLRTPCCPEAIYVLTRRNKKVFDIIISLDDENESKHIAYNTAVWAEDTYRYRDEYEDPAPFSDCEVELASSSGSSHPLVESVSVPHGETYLRGDPLTHGSCFHDTEPTYDNDLEPADENEPPPVVPFGKASRSPKGKAKPKPRRRLKRARGQLQRANNDFASRRLDFAAIQVC